MKNKTYENKFNKTCMTFTPKAKNASEEVLKRYKWRNTYCS